MFVNYNDSYLNWNGSAPFPVIRNANFSPIGGGQPVGIYMTVDLHFGYDFGTTGAFEGTSVYLRCERPARRGPAVRQRRVGFRSRSTPIRSDAC